MSSGPKRFECWAMNSGIIDCYWRDLVPDWGNMVHCFDRGAGLTDIDGFIECNNHFLFIEWKSDGKDLTRGQEIAFERLDKASGRIHILLVEGDPKGPTLTRFKRIGPDSEWRDDKTLEQILKEWWKWADSQ